MMNHILKLTVILLLVNVSLEAQEPRYTVKPIRSVNDGSFKDENPAKQEGKTISYVQANIDLHDISDDDATLIKITGPRLICFESTVKNGKKEGLVQAYVIDSLDRQHRYKIWEQHYKNGLLHGEWRFYTLRGTLAMLQTFESGNLKGIAREYGIGGKILSEREYLGNQDEFIVHEFYPDGKLKKTMTVRHNKFNGVGRRYYGDGKIMEEANFKDDELHGTRKYFYPNGQLWIEQVYKDGLDWEVVANFAEDGKPRNAGTLRGGNGTIIYYNEDGTVRETVTFIQGKKQ